MPREFDMCDVCKLDKANLCNYECIKQREDFMFRFFTCPKFIYDDGNPITNYEMISTRLKDNSDMVADELWDKLIVDPKFNTLDEFKTWLKDKANT